MAACDARPVHAEAPRRTQEQRRGETISRLINAAISALDELGFAGSTTAVVAASAGVSQGALFRHFPTRRDLLAAAAAEVARRQVAAFAARVTTPAHTRDELRDALAAVVSIGASAENRTWQELMLASRTDALLRTALGPATELYQREVMLAAAGVLGEGVDAAGLVPVMRVVLSFTDGLALAAPLTHSDADIAAAVEAFTDLLWPALQAATPSTDQEPPR